MTDFVLFSAIMLALGIGYVIGARRVKKLSLPYLTSSSGLNHRYFEGLTYLLRDEDDKAIDRFVADMAVNDETLDVHLSLGSMLCRKGEFSRAIKVHEHLFQHPNLSFSQKHLVQYELANDYFHSGLLDRAEQLLESLVDVRGVETNLRNRCLVSLVEVYEQTQDWLKAIDIADRLTPQKFSDQVDEWRARQAQYCCELAVKELHSPQRHDEIDSPTKWIRSALKYDPNCVRATLLQARMDIDVGIVHAAMATLKSIPKLDRDFAPEMIKPLFQCYQTLGKEPEFIEELMIYLGYFRDVRALKLLFDLCCRYNGVVAAVKTLRMFLDDYSNFKAASLLGEILELGCGTEKVKDFKPVFDEFFSNVPDYECQKCGFIAVDLHWHCPGCQGWASMRFALDNV